MATELTYTRGQVARALGLDVRQLESWSAQALIGPRVLRGRTRHGNRRQYTWPDVFATAILEEVRKLLGPSFRAGSLAKLLAKTLRSHEYSFLLDTLGVAGRGAAGRGDPHSPLGQRVLLVLSAETGRPTMDVLYSATVDHIPPVALTIDMARLAHQVREALKRGH